MFRLKRSLLWVGILVFIVLVVTVCYSVFACEHQIVIIDESIEENPEGIVTEMALKSVGRVKAAKEEDLEEDFKLEKIIYDFDFENHSYILVYGRPINKLYSDTRTMYGDPVYGKVPDAIVEWDMVTPYESEVMYIYETDKIPLVAAEWN